MTKTISATEYCSSIFDGTHDTPKPSTIGFQLVTSKHITEGSLNLSDAYLISDEDYKSINKRSKVSQWDVLFSMIGTVGWVYLERNSNINYAIKNIGVFSCKDEKRAEWLFYYLKSPAAKRHIQRYLSGAVQKFLSLGALRDFPVLPYDEVASKAINIVAKIDKKIELNNHINAELEAMAKTLYEYWFVQFDFPDANGKPYKTSGGKMVYNPTLKREIPEGWELVSIEHFADVIDPHPSHRAPKEVENGFPFAGIGDIDEAGNISTSKARQIDEEFVLKQERDYEIGEYSLGYGRVGTVGKVVRLKKQKFRYALSPTLSVINPKKSECAGYVYAVVNSNEFYKQVIKNTSGTTRPAVGIQLLRKIPVLKPGNAHKNMFEKYGEITKELFEKSSISNQENQNLIELRDWLLPMLMNGQVKVI